jgi:hypothetical protein
MTFEEKKEYVKNFILLGLELEEAYYHAGLNTKQLEIIEKDEKFREEINFTRRQEHLRLRELYKNTAETAAKQKLDWKAALSLLEVSFPDRYGKNKKIEEDDSDGVLKIDEDDKKLL